MASCIIFWSNLIVPLFLLHCCSCTTFTSAPNSEIRGHYENIHATITHHDGVSLNRVKRQFQVYECKRERCDDGVCKPEYYNGPHPPAWCRDGKPHKKETKCNWSKSCSNFQPCVIQSTSCNHQYEDQGGRKSTFNFECFARENMCNVVECAGIDNCKPAVRISMRQFEQEFVKGLPNCQDVDGRRRGKRGAPPSVQSLIGYCCEIAERWKGVKIATVRPIVS